MQDAGLLSGSFGTGGGCGRHTHARASVSCVQLGLRLAASNFLPPPTFLFRDESRHSANRILFKRHLLKRIPAAGLDRPERFEVQDLPTARPHHPNRARVFRPRMPSRTAGTRFGHGTVRRVRSAGARGAYSSGVRPVISWRRRSAHPSERRALQASCDTSRPGTGDGQDRSAAG